MKAAERLEARRLRSEGNSIEEICQQLGVSKATVSVWVRDIQLDPVRVKRLDEKQRQFRVRSSYFYRSGDAHPNRVEERARHQV